MKFNNSEIKEITIQLSDGHVAKIESPKEIGFDVHRELNGMIREVLVLKYDREKFHMNW